jgi:hypothetical protein
VSKSAQFRRLTPIGDRFIARLHRTVAQLLGSLEYGVYPTLMALLNPRAAVAQMRGGRL